MPRLHQGCLFKAGNLCREKSTSCFTAATADLLLAPKPPQTTPSEEGAHPAAPTGLVQPLSLCRRWGTCGHRLAPCPGAGVRRAACIPLPRGGDPHPPPAHAADPELAQLSSRTSSCDRQFQFRPATTLQQNKHTISSVAGCWSLSSVRLAPSALPGCAG